MCDQETKSYIVWIDNTDRIASFRFVEGYEKIAFTSHDFFMSYLHGLQVKGFRFQ